MDNKSRVLKAPRATRDEWIASVANRGLVSCASRQEKVPGLLRSIADCPGKYAALCAECFRLETGVYPFDCVLTRVPFYRHFVTQSFESLCSKIDVFVESGVLEELGGSNECFLRLADWFESCLQSYTGIDYEVLLYEEGVTLVQGPHSQFVADQVRESILRGSVSGLLRDGHVVCRWRLL